MSPSSGNNKNNNKKETTRGDHQTSNSHGIKVGDLIIDPEQKIILLVIEIKIAEEKKAWLGKYNFNVYWIKDKKRSWIPEMLICAIRDFGFKKATSIIIDAIGVNNRESNNGNKKTK